jgi:ATP-dependent protease HslVU (ClpYQ) peptidase subunit
VTTIAYDGRYVAGDGRSELYDIIVSDTSEKIRVHNGRVYAFAGTPQMYSLVAAWLGERDWSVPAPTAPEGKWQALIFSAREGKIIAEYAGQEVPYPIEMQEPLALGSGCQFAMAIMTAGGTARRAVEIACRLDPWSGGSIQVVNIAEALGLQSVREAAE